MASNTDFANGENEITSPKKTLVNSESLPVTTNGDALNNSSPATLDFPERSEQSTSSKKTEDSFDYDSDALSDTDALTTMNAIMAYNRQLVARLQKLEQKVDEQGEELNDSIEDAVGDLKDALPDRNNKNPRKSKPKEKSTGDFTHVMPNYDKSTDTKGTNHSFEFPIGDLLMGSGNFDTTPLEDKQKEEEDPKKKNDDEETVRDGDDNNSSGGIRISDGDKDDIVIKVEATKKGITFCIHIPRN